MVADKINIRLLDLCCKGGGCSVGYEQAAIDLGLSIKIIGVDKEPQPNYPYEFIQADAFNYLKKNGSRFTHIHVSPPCQKYSTQSAIFRAEGKKYSDLCERITPLMYESGKPGVIENVMPAPIRADIVLRGDMFGLKTLRKRKFELVNWFMLQPGMERILPGAVVDRGEYITCTGKGNLGSMNKKKQYTKFIHAGESVLDTWSRAMGISWMTVDEMREAIPPAYTRYIGYNFLKA